MPRALGSGALPLGEYQWQRCDLSRVSTPFPASIQRLCRSHWPRVLRRRSAAARQLRSWVRIPPGSWMFVLCECCVLSGRGLCDELITRPDESYQLWCVVVCDLENLKNEEAMTRVGSQRHSKKRKRKIQRLSLESPSEG